MQRELGQLDAAYDLFRKVAVADPTRQQIWELAGGILGDLGRVDELRILIEDMLRACSRTPETLLQAATMARSGQLHVLAADLLDPALSPAAAPSAAMIVKAAQILLADGEHGRVIHLLDNESIRSDPDLQRYALDLRGLALAQLCLAGANAGEPISENARADLVAVRSIFEHGKGVQASSKRTQREIAILLSSLAPGVVEGQVVQLVRQLCSEREIGRIFVLITTPSKLPPEFHNGTVPGMNVVVEAIADFDIDINRLVPARLAGQLSVLPGRLFDRTAFLIDRLRTHKPDAVIAMTETNGLAAALAASVVGVPRVLVSARSQPSGQRGLRDVLLKPAYRDALAMGRIAVVTNNSPTARDYLTWLRQPPDRVGVRAPADALLET